MRPNLATIDLTAGAGRAGLSVGQRVRIQASGLYSGDIAVVEGLFTGVIPSATVTMPAPGGTIGHAELEIGDSLLMLSDTFPQATTRPPKELGGTTTSVFMYAEDVDAVVQRAVDAGATVTMEVADQFWGDRFGSIQDPFGHSWSIATHVEDVSPEDMAERAKAAMAAMEG